MQSEIRVEGSQRLNAIRTLMRERDLDALLIYSQKRGHVAYVSGYVPNYHTNSAVVIVPLDGEPVLLIRFGFDLPRARTLSWFRDIRTVDPTHPGGFLQQCFQTAAEMNLTSAKIGLVAGDDTVDEGGLSLTRSLQQELPRAHIQHVTELITRMRLSKQPAEVQRLRRSTELAELAAGALQKSLIPGNEDFEAMGAAAFAAIRGGADRCDAIISTGPAHLALPPCHLRFESGSPVSVELTVLCEGYWVQVCRTYALGTVSPTQKRLFHACLEAYQAAVDVARPGRPVADLAKAAINPLDKSGFEGCIQYGLGHGVGLDLPEPYEVELCSRDSLVDRMVLVVHVGAWASDRQAAAFVGGPIIVHPQGASHLDHPQSEIIEV
jgi:Xaa-Pro aminopeptidase